MEFTPKNFNLSKKNYEIGSTASGNYQTYVENHNKDGREKKLPRKRRKTSFP
ncbi:hypothetical protein CTRC342_03490 [Chlamydia trachomatis RC-F(s)/342]|nr:hypothetical protein CTRC852_03500 [Chlamydia trachomatis RC-F(s)/852]AGR99655.1 hypothetical protein CTRC342_03490 [Chlamydia trachomatis RC-F(s)/342]